ncbi:8-oxo-dGTP pyrophosphatase MutT, NUDIX family [Pseudomonas anguilliseptica]|uniref:8-oxo-dGTP pyrophosphatase MutT, NUDIX family n=1 Tax=Pseudomonas anguilliseptica TaxID=53406 RepID=A0A1H5I1I2_PSEAG|nr:8-oxo-dGTP pyrophosphatase MutT, NUDIX family [Pseudomonas anguilliseptica]
MAFRVAKASITTALMEAGLEDARGPNLLATKACPVVVRMIDGLEYLLVFKHPLAGYQLVKGTIEWAERPAHAAVRELAEESGICNAQAVRDLGSWNAGYEQQIWSFQLCEVAESLPHQWRFNTDDDGGHVFEFFWHPLSADFPTPCHRLFQAAWAQIRKRLYATNADTHKPLQMLTAAHRSTQKPT